MHIRRNWRVTVWTRTRTKSCRQIHTQSFACRMSFAWKSRKTDESFTHGSAVSYQAFVYMFVTLPSSESRGESSFELLSNFSPPVHLKLRCRASFSNFSATTVPCLGSSSRTCTRGERQTKSPRALHVTWQEKYTLPPPLWTTLLMSTAVWKKRVEQAREQMNDFKGDTGGRAKLLKHWSA